MSSFLGLNIAMKGIFASQRSIYVVDHNISNADTEGYSRQISGQTASLPLKAGRNLGMIGTGVNSTDVTRIRDIFLDKRYWEQNPKYGEWNVKSSSLYQIEAIMNETSENGLNGVMALFISSMEELCKYPESDEVRTIIRQNGEALCKYLNSSAATLTDFREDYNQCVKIKINEINSCAKQIRDLNEQIYKAELNGTIANDLRDKRDLLVDKLSQIADVEVNEIKTGTLPDGRQDIRFQVTINGQNLVSHFQVNELQCYEIDDDSINNGMYGIKWENTGNEIRIEGGELKAYLDLRDGNGEKGSYKGVPYYMNMLDTFASTLAKAFNEGIYADGIQQCSGHAAGYGLDGSTGVRFFTCNGMSSEEFMESGADTGSIYSNISAANISVSSDILADTDKLAAASSSGGAGNSENADILLSIFSDSGVFDEGMPEDYINTIVSNMGINSDYASRLSDTQESILNKIENSRISVSGVSLDEETTKLVKYQQTYNAASKMISVLDELLDTTINKMGMG
ncbi:MAG TPA: flagellar hook-associated protein FlgK [Clostridia bacterium]|nr:flagellar hook-associated protein FlgK [Clostridia bacterium]